MIPRELKVLMGKSHPTGKTHVDCGISAHQNRGLRANHS